MKDEYSETKFLFPEATESLPKRFGIVTAFNTKGKPQSAIANWQDDRSLYAALIEGGYAPFRVIGISDDGKHAEPGFGFGAPDTRAVSEIAKRFNQDAFFWIKDGKLQIKDTRSLAFDDIGSFHERVI